MKDVTPYSITLKRDWNGDEWEWVWFLSQDAKEIAGGSKVLRWSAIWAAKRAARRHSKGKTPLRLPRTKPDTFYYLPRDRSL